MLTKEQVSERMKTFNEKQNELINTFTSVIEELKREGVLFVESENTLYLLNAKGLQLTEPDRQDEANLPNGLYDLLDSRCMELDIYEWYACDTENPVLVETW